MGNFLPKISCPIDDEVASFGKIIDFVKVQRDGEITRVESTHPDQEKKILPQTNTDLQLSIKYHEDDISKIKVGVQQISGSLEENFEEGGQDDRKWRDEMSSSFVYELVARRDCVNSSELWYSTVSHSVKHEGSEIDCNSQTEYAFVRVPKKKETITSPEEHSEYDDVLVLRRHS